MDRHLQWKADGSLTRLRAELPEPGAHLIIDHDPHRPGDAQWHLTWFDPNRSDVPAEGHHLQSHVTADDLKDEAEEWADL